MGLGFVLYALCVMKTAYYYCGLQTNRSNIMHSKRHLIIIAIHRYRIILNRYLLTLQSVMRANWHPENTRRKQSGTRVASLRRFADAEFLWNAADDWWTTLSRARVPPSCMHMSSLFNYDGDSSYGDGNQITNLGNGRNVYNSPIIFIRCYFRR